MREIGLYVTAACNWHCRDCSQAPWMRDRAGWSLGLDALDATLARIAAVGGYRRIVLTGGEPTLWPYLLPALVRIREAGLAAGLNSNGTAPALVRRATAAGLIDRVCPNVAPRHLPLPAAPLDNVLPPVCGCPRHTVMGDEVAVCGNWYSVSRRTGLDPAAGLCPIGEDWRRAFAHAAIEGFPWPQCAACHCNARIHPRPSRRPPP